MNILISYFDPFDGRLKNNSEKFAKLIQQNLNSAKINIQLCKLRTVYDKAFVRLQDCVNSRDDELDLIISLGESRCEMLTLETRGINLDNSKGPDNDSSVRESSEIISGGEKYLGVTLPLQKAFCELSVKSQKSFKLSTNAGSFVCNNTLYHGLNKLKFPYTFIHVPSNDVISDSQTQELSKDLSDFIFNLSRHCSVSICQPKSRDETESKLLAELSRCEEEFYTVLKNEY